MNHVQRSVNIERCESIALGPPLFAIKFQQIYRLYWPVIASQGKIVQNPSCDLIRKYQYQNIQSNKINNLSEKSNYRNASTHHPRPSSEIHASLSSITTAITCHTPNGASTCTACFRSPFHQKLLVWPKIKIVSSTHF